MKKKYCKNCKFKTIFTMTYCEPYVPVGIRISDYEGPRHLIRKKVIGTFEREKKNAKNDCFLYVKKWWKFWLK